MVPINKKLKGAKLMMLATVMCFADPSLAEEADLLDTLLNNGVITQDQYEQLKAQQTKPTQVPPRPSQEVQDVVVTTKGGLSGRTPDGAFTFRLGGRLLIDGALYDKDKQRLGNGSEIRRARVDLEGTAWNVWGYGAEYDFAEDEVEIRDAYIQYSGFDPLRVRIGHLKEPFSLEEQTSSLFITFMERALPNVFAPDRNLGLSVHVYADHWTLDAGVFGEGVDDQNDDDGESNEGLGTSARATLAPLQMGTRLAHVGASVAYRDTGTDDRVRFRTRPESHITDIRFVNTGQIQDVDDTLRYGAEAAAVYGPFSVQGEYIRTSVNRKGSLNDLDFDGFYVYGSWLLTGESRTYRSKLGEFGRIKPRGSVGRGGLGAWEVAVRYSKVDLNERDVQGGKEDNLTVALNWYATPNVRAMFNYIRVNNDTNANDDDRVFDDGSRVPGNDDPNIFQARLQIDF